MFSSTAFRKKRYLIFWSCHGVGWLWIYCPFTIWRFFDVLTIWQNSAHIWPLSFYHARGKFSAPVVLKPMFSTVIAFGHKKESSAKTCLQHESATLKQLAISDQEDFWNKTETKLRNTTTAIIHKTSELLQLWMKIQDSVATCTRTFTLWLQEITAYNDFRLLFVYQTMWNCTGLFFEFLFIDSRTCCSNWQTFV